MGFAFATCNRKSALDFIKRSYPNTDITDTPDNAGLLLNFVEKDIVRIQDPMMHGNSNVIAGTNWDDKYKDDITKACKQINNLPDIPKG